MTPSQAPRWVAVGRVTRAHGVKGEVAVLPLSEVEGRFAPGSRVFVGEGEDRPLTVRKVRGPHRGRLLVFFEEVRTRTAAEELRGAYLFVPAEWAPELPEGAFWAHELVGCEVTTEGGRSLGRVREVIHTPANDVWVAEGEAGEVLVPALREVVASVDLAARRVVVREVPGLTGE
ncbi:MAG TPA: ribosome maturation factor RimM [Actinomycetota bacterium]|nr:ribosome maturation factor RimM [Actinomycetota bacterium]